MVVKRIKSFFKDAPRPKITACDQSREGSHLVLKYHDDGSNVAGIARFQLAIAAISFSLSRLHAHSAYGEIFIDDVHPGQDVLLGMHLHLLPNGHHTITFELIESNGLLSTVQAIVKVNNNSKLAAETLRLLREHGTPLFFEGACDSSMYPYDKHQNWFDRPDADLYIDRMIEDAKINHEEAENLRNFILNGFMILPGLIDESLISKVNKEIDDVIESGYQNYKYGSSQRIEHLHNNHPSIRQLWLDERHLRYASLIFGETARPCQTLTYVFGSQQNAHQDTIHLTPFPAGYMCGTWIALQDVVPDSGELVVYRGSHRERRVYLAETGCAKVTTDWTSFGQSVGRIWEEMARKYEPYIYRPTKGTVLIWHENLLHGGSVRKDSALERRSIVIHSFADGALAYYDSTGNVGSAIDVAELRS